ncbi:MAG: hypothetical protein WBQ92_18570, partial [Pseudomonas alloputida]
AEASASLEKSIDGGQLELLWVLGHAKHPGVGFFVQHPGRSSDRCRSGFTREYGSAGTGERPVESGRCISGMQKSGKRRMGSAFPASGETEQGVA